MDSTAHELQIASICMMMNSVEVKILNFLMSDKISGLCTVNLYSNLSTTSLTLLVNTSSWCYFTKLESNFVDPGSSRSQYISV